MRTEDLPPKKREELLGHWAVHGLNCDRILRFAIENLPFNTPGAAEDREARIERSVKWGILKNEFNSLMDPIRAQHPDLGTDKLISFLSGPDQARAYAIDRELLEMTGVTQVKSDRLTWQEAVGNEILHQLHRASIDVDQIVAAVLARDPSYPPGPVRKYVESVFKRAILGEHLATRRMKDT